MPKRRKFGDEYYTYLIVSPRKVVADDIKKRIQADGEKAKVIKSGKYYEVWYRK